MNKNYRRENSNFNSKQFSAMKSIKVIVMFIFFSVFLVGSISAFEIDNVKTFNETDRSLVVHNAFNLPLIGSDIAKITPLTPHVVSVFRGVNRTVAEFQIENYADNYSNVFKEMEFYNLKNNNAIEDRQFFFQYEVITGTEEKAVYENRCENKLFGNGTNYKDCSNVFLKNEVVNVTKWKDLDISNPLSKGTFKIRIITDVKPNEHMEFIPTWFGVRMPEYSEWTETLNVGLFAFYKFDEQDTTGTGTILNEVGINATNSGADNSTGRINTAYNYVSANSDFMNATDLSDFADLTAFTLSAWIFQPSTVATSRIISTKWDFATNGTFGLQTLDTGDNLIFWVLDSPTESGNNQVSTSAAGMIPDTWFHIVAVYNGSAGASDRAKIYVNATLPTQAITGTIPTTVIHSNADLRFGRFGGSLTRHFNGTIDEVGFWNRSLTAAEVTQLFNNGIGISFTDVFVPTVTLNSPVDNFNTVNQTIDFNGTVVSSIGITNVSLFIDGILNETNSSGTNDTEYFFTKTIDNGTHDWTYESCNADGCTTPATRDFTIGFIENSQTFNSSTFETKTETFIINITTGGNAPSSANLFYDGTNKGSATITDIGDDNFDISKTIDIPIGTGNNSWFFNTVINSITFNSSSNQQEVSEINLTFCQASPQDVPYINFTFTNETVAEESISAEIDSNFNYWLGSGDILKSLSFTNTTENFNYTFCFSPANQTLNADVNLTYDNSISQLRSFAQTFSLTNVTTTQNLFLLPTVDGIFVTFQVVDPAEQVISGVSANVTKEGNIISSGITDDAGLITYFLDPDTTYVFTFSKTGLTGVTTTLVPTQTSFTIIMGVVTTINQFDTTIGIDYTITPTNLTLVNGTDVNFSLDLTSVFFSLEEFGFVLKNSTGTIFNSTSSTTDTGGLLSQTLNTGSNTDITMEVFWTITGNQTNVTRIWLVFNLENEGFSVLTFFNDLSIYLTSGLFGLDAFGLGIIVFLIILISTGIVSVKFGITSPPGISIVVFSLVAFFDVALGIMPNPINAIPNFPTIFVGLIFLGILYSEVIR
ncbi:hypothetical protein LCGC14_0953620 [marine sediment metagenome]|uniref:LamG-like jellyroll fold domain-containing protein n=1 Tax=marine sediment metagenome TaxID=412755 RepID=A0A0F9P2K7_9ZZZZ